MPEDASGELLISLDDLKAQVIAPPAITIDLGEPLPSSSGSSDGAVVELVPQASQALVIELPRHTPESPVAGSSDIPQLLERQRELAARLIKLRADADRARKEFEARKDKQVAELQATRDEAVARAESTRTRAAADADARAATAKLGIDQTSEQLGALRTQSQTFAAANVGAMAAGRLTREGEAAAPLSGFQNSATHAKAANDGAAELASAVNSTPAGRAAKPFGWIAAIALFIVIAGFGQIMAAIIAGPIAGFVVFLAMRARARTALETSAREAFRLIIAAERAVAADLARVQEAASAEKSAAQQTASAATSEADERHRRTLAGLTETLDSERRDLDRRNLEAGRLFGAETTSYRQQIDQVAPDWDVLLKDWAPGPSSGGALLRLGEHVGGFAGEQFRWPAVLAFPRSGATAFVAGGEDLKLAVRAMQSLFLQILLRSDPGLVRYLFLDPVGSGERVAPFMPLREVDDGILIHGKAWSESRDMEQRLVEMSGRVSDIIHRLGDQHPDVVAFNSGAPVRQHLVAMGVFDYPSNFTEDTSRRLSALIKSGPRCGVVPLILVDSALTPIRGATPVGDVASRISAEAGRWSWDGMGEGLTLELTVLPPADRFKDALARASEAARGTDDVRMRFADYAVGSGEWWKEDSRSQLSVPLGPLAASHKALEVCIGKGGANHALIVGQTGSGKSKLLHALILGLCMRYSPVELELYLVDFKGGVEFKPYAEHGLPHARVVAIDSEPEFGLSVLDALVREQRRREEIFRAAGVQNISEYEETTRLDLSRIVLIVDEFQVMFREDDPVSRRSAERIEQLVRQARSFGIHILLATQSLAGSTQLSRATMDQMVVRIALMSSEADSRLVLADDNSAARLLTRPGQAIYNDSRGLPEKNQEFQCVLIESDEIDEVVEEAAQRARQLAEARPDYYQPRPRRVFEGNTTSDFATCPEYADIRRQQPADEPTAPVAWLGEPIAIGPSLKAPFKRESGHNLLVAGSDERVATGILRAALLGLGAQFPTTVEPARFLFVDVRPEDSPLAGLFEELAATLPSASLYGRAGVRQAVVLASEEVSRRLQSPDGPHPCMFLVLPALHRLRDLRKEEGPAPYRPYDPDAPAPPEPLSQLFARILREGSAVGVHVITWTDSTASLNRVLDYGGLREFGYRIALQMSANDSSALIDVPAASSLGANRAIFFADDGREPAKFRPFGLPDSWIAGFDDLA